MASKAVSASTSKQDARYLVMIDDCLDEIKTIHKDIVQKRIQGRKVKNRIDRNLDRIQTTIDRVKAAIWVRSASRSFRSRNAKESWGHWRSSSACREPHRKGSSFGSWTATNSRARSAWTGQTDLEVGECLVPNRENPSFFFNEYKEAERLNSDHSLIECELKPINICFEKRYDDL